MRYIFLLPLHAIVSGRENCFGRPRGDDPRRRWSTGEDRGRGREGEVDPNSAKEIMIHSFLLHASLVSMININVGPAVAARVKNM